MHGESWSDDRIAALRRLWDQGKTTGAIAAEIGVTRSAVCAKARRLNLSSRPKVAQTADQRFDALIDLVAEDDVPVAQAARQVGLSVPNAAARFDALCRQMGWQAQ